jgi:hypothetical protein
MENTNNIGDNNNEKTQDEKYTEKDQIENIKDDEEDSSRKSYSSIEFQNPNINNNNSQNGNKNVFNNNINNLNNSINNQIIYFASQFLQIEGWSLFDKYGYKINDFNSLDLLTYLTEKVSENIDLDNYKILAQNTENYYKGGNLFLSLFYNLSLVLLQKKDEYNKQIINILLQINNNNYRFNNDFSINLGNSINFPYNSNLNSNINLNNLNNNNLMSNLNI